MGINLKEDQMTIIHARPNMNGNTATDFQKTALAAQEVGQQITALIGKISANVVHGRNYQTLDHADIRRETDLRHLTRLAEMEADLRELAMAIFDASRPGTMPAHISLKIRKAS
jgi:hypothetical protein